MLEVVTAGSERSLNGRTHLFEYTSRADHNCCPHTHVSNEATLDPPDMSGRPHHTPYFCPGAKSRPCQPSCPDTAFLDSSCLQYHRTYHTSSAPALLALLYYHSRSLSDLETPTHSISRASARHTANATNVAGAKTPWGQAQLAKDRQVASPHWLPEAATASEGFMTYKRSAPFSTSTGNVTRPVHAKQAHMLDCNHVHAFISTTSSQVQTSCDTSHSNGAQPRLSQHRLKFTLAAIDSTESTVPKFNVKFVHSLHQSCQHSQMSSQAMQAYRLFLSIGVYMQRSLAAWRPKEETSS